MGPIAKKLLLVVGSGRSGTHLTGRLLSAIPQSVYNEEGKPIFPCVVNLATSTINPQKIKQLVELYNNWLSAYPDCNLFIDKSHPNLWLYDALDIPNTALYYIAVYRNIYDTVYSMLRHKGVLTWFDKLGSAKNHFLGIINDEILASYPEMPIEAKCTLRIIAHYARIIKIQNKTNVFVLKYDHLVKNSSHSLDKLARFLRCEPKALSLNAKIIKPERVGRGLKKLSTKQILLINHSLQSFGPYFELNAIDIDKLRTH